MTSCTPTAADASFFVSRALTKKVAIAEAKAAARPKAAKARKPAKAKLVQPDEPIWLRGQPSEDEAEPTGLKGFTFSLETALMIGHDCGPLVRRTERPAMRKAESAGDCSVPRWSCGFCQWVTLAAAALLLHAYWPEPAQPAAQGGQLAA